MSQFETTTPEKAQTITRGDLVEELYNQLGLSRRECKTLVEQILDGMSEALIAGDSVKISSFGSFLVRDKKERVGRNPRTGEFATITPRKVLSFRASAMLKQKMNNE
ncbi:MAG: integration host factor subunit alpha [Alphaproteobacteria bacterium]|nr:integration host factor subunit alpha [Alphaproteobacteria bacterium]